MFCARERGDHMADVLLSLKHAVVHPHQVGEPRISPIPHPCPLPPLHAPYGTYLTSSFNDCQLPPSFSPESSVLELPSSILGDTFEETFLGDPREIVNFSFSCLESPTNTARSSSLVASPHTFTQLTSSPPQPYPDISCPISMSTVKSILNSVSPDPFQSLMSSTSNPTAASTTITRASAFSSPNRLSPILLSSHSSAFTPVVSLQPFIYTTQNYPPSVATLDELKNLQNNIEEHSLHNLQGSFTPIPSLPNFLNSTESNLMANCNSSNLISGETTSPIFSNDNLSKATLENMGKCDPNLGSAYDSSLGLKSSVASNFSISFGQPITTYLNPTLVDGSPTRALPPLSLSTNLPKLDSDLGKCSTIVTTLGSAEFTGVATGIVTSSLLTQQPHPTPYDEVGSSSRIWTHHVDIFATALLTSFVYTGWSF